MLLCICEDNYKNNCMYSGTNWLPSILSQVIPSYMYFLYLCKTTMYQDIFFDSTLKNKYSVS